MPTSTAPVPNYYPPVNFHFAVYFGGPSSGKTKSDPFQLVGEGISFQSVGGLTVSMQTETIKEGGESRFEHVVPVRAKYSDLVLKRGLVYKKSPVLDWIQNAIENFQFKPKDMQIHLLNNDHEALVKWDVFNVWPKNWKFDEMNAEQGKVFIETLELSYNYFRMSE